MAQWFFDSFYTLAAVTKMESALVNYARTQLMYRLVEEHDFSLVVDLLKGKQEELLRANPRWKKCNLSLEKNPLVRDHATLHIGGSNLTLVLVKGEF